MAAAVFSTSTSSLRASQSRAASPLVSYYDSPLTQLPSVDIPFDDLRRRMSEFTAKFDAFIERSRKRVLEERNDYRARMSELNEEQRSTKTQMTTLSSVISTQATVVAREAAEKREMQTQIEKLESHHGMQVQHRDKLKQEIAATQRQIDQKIEAQRQYAKKMEAQSRLNGPELTFWETYLGCRIEGAGEEDRVRITYEFPNGDASFELKVPVDGMYEVLNTRPSLSTDDRVEGIVARLNETREIGVLLKGMRALFKECVK